MKILKNIAIGIGVLIGLAFFGLVAMAVLSCSYSAGSSEACIAEFFKP